MQTKNGYGSLLVTTLTGINSAVKVGGIVGKSGIGFRNGYWSTTRGFLNSNKYIQDSYFYQDYSYQIKVATVLSDYRSILYNTFHPAGSEMFGEYQLILSENSPLDILVDITIANTGPSANISIDYTSDSTVILSDSFVTVDTTLAYINMSTINLTSDLTSLTSDSANNTMDAINTN